MEEKQICFVKSSDSEIKKMVANVVLESTKKSTTIIMLSTSLEVKKVMGTDFQIARVYFT